MIPMSDRFLLHLASSACFLAIVAFFRLPIAHTQPQQVGEFYETIQSGDLSGAIDPNSQDGYYDGEEAKLPLADLLDEKQYVLGANNENKWIEVDLSEQKLRAWEGDHLFLETLVSTGLPYFPTPQGEFTIWTKLRATRMHGGTGA